jgi:hypothetical protein
VFLLWAILVGAIVSAYAASRSNDFGRFRGSIEVKNHDLLTELRDMMSPRNDPVWIANFAHQVNWRNAHLSVKNAIKASVARTDSNCLVRPDDFWNSDLVIPVKKGKWVACTRVVEHQGATIKDCPHISGRSVPRVIQGEPYRDYDSCADRQIEKSDFAIALGWNFLIDNLKRRFIEIHESSISGDESLESYNRIGPNENESEEPDSIICFAMPTLLLTISVPVAVWGFGHHTRAGFLAVLSALAISFIATMMLFDGGLRIIL